LPGKEKGKQKKKLVENLKIHSDLPHHFLKEKPNWLGGGGN
jgi:hypothetical protein